MSENKGTSKFEVKSKKRRTIEVSVIILACIMALLILSGCGCGPSLMCKMSKHCAYIF